MPFGIRTATPPGDWRSFKFIVTAPGGHDHGDLVLVRETVGFINIVYLQYDANNCPMARHVDIGDNAVLVYQCEKLEICKLTGSGQVFLPGDNVYWSGVAATCVSPIRFQGWYKIGICTEPADEHDEFVEIDLEGDQATLLE